MQEELAARARAQHALRAPEQPRCHPLRGAFLPALFEMLAERTHNERFDRYIAPMALLSRTL
ncbi:hypothetical protein ACWGTI_32150 [Mesorhizobium sp. ArgA1]